MILIMNTVPSAPETSMKGAYGATESNNLPPRRAKIVVPIEPKRMLVR